MITKATTAAGHDDWDRHWERYSDAAQTNPAHEYRRKLMFGLLGLHNSDSGVRIIDVGSGQGDMAAAVLSRYPKAQLVGLELSQSGVEISRRRVPRARFVQCDLLASNNPPEDLRGWATHAVCSEVIEHVDDPVKLLRNAQQYMGAGCQLILTAPGGPMSAFDKHIGHRRHFRPEDIDVMLREAGYVPERVTTAGFPFFNLYRCVVVLRGQKLIEDCSAPQNPTPARSAQIAIALFDALFRFNLDSSRWGWQMVAKAHTVNNRGC